MHQRRIKEREKKVTKRKMKQVLTVSCWSGVIGTQKWGRKRSLHVKRIRERMTREKHEDAWREGNVGEKWKGNVAEKWKNMCRSVQQENQQQQHSGSSERKENMKTRTRKQQNESSNGTAGKVSRKRQIEKITSEAV